MGTKFHHDTVFYDHRDASNHFKTRDQFYADIVKHSLTMAKKGLLSEMIAEWSHMALGRRRWLITKEMANILYDIPVDPDMSNIAWPYDAWSLCFEEGTVIDGLTFRWMRIFSGKSELIKTMVDKSLKVRLDNSNSATFQCDPGLDEEYQPDLNSEDPLVMFRTIDLNAFNPYKASTTKLEAGYSQPALPQHIEIHSRIMNVTAKVCASAMLLYAARPDVLVPAQMNGKERRSWQAHGGSANISHMKFPTSKKIHGPSVPTPTGRTVANHFRGWVLRTLRHERYKRNADGSLRVILVEPCEINAPDEHA